MRTLLTLALTVGLILLSVTGPASAQAGPSEAVIQGWLGRFAGTVDRPIGIVSTTGNPPVAGRVEYVERCSAILILTGINRPDPRSAQQIHYPLLWAHVIDAGQVPGGLAFLLTYNRNQPPVLDIGIDAATVAGLAQTIQDCRTTAAMTTTYDALATLLEQTLSEAPDLIVNRDELCRFTLSRGSRSHIVVDGSAGVSRNGPVLRVDDWTNGTETHFSMGPENAHRADELIGVLRSHCALMSDLAA